MPANSYDERLRTSTESKIILHLMGHPASRYSEIYKGMNASGSKISHPTLSAHLKRMRVPGGLVRLEGDRYYANEKSHQQTFAFVKKSMEAYAIAQAGLALLYGR